MTNTTIEHTRTIISTNLTKILILFGRLNPEYNARYLPVTVTSILHLLKELEELEKDNRHFAAILGENIERRQKHLDVFSIPESMKSNPDTQGLRMALYDHTEPLIKAYCEEEKLFLNEGLGPQVSRLVRSSLLMRTEKNCKLLSTLCKAESCQRLDELNNWCRQELGNLSRNA